jgi:hypothetical protein
MSRSYFLLLLHNNDFRVRMQLHLDDGFLVTIPRSISWRVVFYNSSYSSMVVIDNNLGGHFNFDMIASVNLDSGTITLMGYKETLPAKSYRNFIIFGRKYRTRTIATASSSNNPQMTSTNTVTILFFGTSQCPTPITRTHSGM